MTQVIFKKQRGQFKAITVTGHAGYAEEGEDIVCAAITSAIQFLHILLDDVLLLNLETTVIQEQTFIGITLPDELTDSENREAQHAFRALHKHYDELEKDYAHFIKVMEVQNDA